MKKILWVKKDSITEESKSQLTKEGYIVLESENITDIKVVDGFADLDAGSLLNCALKALGTGNDNAGRIAFEKNIRESLIDKMRSKT